MRTTFFCLFILTLVLFSGFQNCAQPNQISQQDIASAMSAGGGPGSPASAILKKSCKEILQAGDSIGSGNYTIFPSGTGLLVYCDMVTDGGGWTMIAKGVTLDSSLTDFNAQTIFSTFTVDFSIGSNIQNALISNSPSAVEIAIVGNDSDGTEAWEVGNFPKSAFTLGSTFLTLNVACGSAINAAASFSIAKGARIGKRSSSGYYCHETTASALSQYGGIGASRWYASAGGLYRASSLFSTNATVYFREQ